MSGSFWKIWIDTGGTFSDCIALTPEFDLLKLKILSNSSLRVSIVDAFKHGVWITDSNQLPQDFFKGYSVRKLGDSQQFLISSYDASLQQLYLEDYIPDHFTKGDAIELLSPEEPPIFASRILTKKRLEEALPHILMKLATTKGTNALLERKGGKTALFITKGFGDFLEIGNQQRPDLFALNIQKKKMLYSRVIEVEQRMNYQGEVIFPLNSKRIFEQAKMALNSGCESAAVVFMHSYSNSSHEQEVGKLLKDIGFKHVSLSSDLVPFMGMLSKAETTIANAVLAPVVVSYLNDVERNIGSDNLLVMSSAGTLAGRTEFQPKDSLLSGPAGGVVGAATIAINEGYSKAISFDMGGTSTDVARIDGAPELTFEHRVGDAHLVAPAIYIETVAAGGGSICAFDGYTITVGPDSAGAFPGPACYGAGGPLTITDLNLLAGNLSPKNFQIPIYPNKAKEALVELQSEIHIATGELIPLNKLIDGFLATANEKMADAIRSVSAQKGYDVREYALVSFGGAGGQHACSIAELLGIKTVILPADAGLLSAFGLGESVVSVFEQKQLLLSLTKENKYFFEEACAHLSETAMLRLKEHYPTVSTADSSKEIHVSLRFEGQHHAIEVIIQDFDEIESAFKKAYEDRFGHWLDDTTIEIVALRVRIAESKRNIASKHAELANYEPEPVSFNFSLVDDTEESIPFFLTNNLLPGATIFGPAVVADDFNTVVIKMGWKAEMSRQGNLILEQLDAEKVANDSVDSAEAIELQLFTNRLTTIATEMGNMLQRTAMSVNVKDRLDFSCALLSPDGDLVVNAPHIPVHLGALGLCVRTLKDQFPLQSGDVLVTNHPAYGGSHLPDITVVTPIFSEQSTLLGFAASRAHHAELGGKSPGSMPPDAKSLSEEGVVIAPYFLYRSGKADWEGIKSVLTQGSYPTRNVTENIADLKAAVAANQKGKMLLLQLSHQHGEDRIKHYMKAIREHAKMKTRAMISRMDDLEVVSKEFLDDGSVIQAHLTIKNEHITIDFEGTSPVHPGNLNATPAIVNSVVMYVLRVLTGENIPLNDGILDCVTLKLPTCLLNPDFDQNPDHCPAVVGGNTEVSQRLTDTLLKPFEVVACSQGTMNNVLFGNQKFGYYETIGGGTGAGNGFNGLDAVHHHMTNTRGTDPEILEYNYPVRLDCYAIRKGSGGHGKWKGGDGIVREMTFLDDVTLTVMTQHRIQKPYGIKGGQPGATGNQKVIFASGESVNLKPSDQLKLRRGDRFVIQTPGGGGYGKE